MVLRCVVSFLMSSLLSICEYLSDSEESDGSEVKARVKLPAPDLSKVSVVPTDVHVDDPQLHGGRARSFPHVRGNWATYVYVKYPAEDILNIFLETLEKILISRNQNWEKCNDIHISLSRTFTLQYHLIAPFTKSLQDAVNKEESFELEFSGLNVYVNDEKTRTFIALDLDHYSQRHLIALTKNIDTILSDYKLPKFYEDPSYHMSLFWINGDRKLEATTILEELTDLVSSEIKKLFRTSLVDRVNCKSGNKYFQYFLE